MSDEIQLMDGEFKFLIPLAKATQDDNGALFVEGIASDTGEDRQQEAISLKGQESMVRWAQAGKVVLGGEADHFAIAFDDDLGTLVDGAVTDKEEFYIKAQLDPDNGRALTLHTSLKKGKQLGLSVFGRITEFHDEEGTPVIDGVQLTRVMVTPSPANPRTWLSDVAKSLRPDQVQEPTPVLEDPVATEAPETPDEPTVAKKIKDVDEWDGSASRWDTADDYCAACLIDANAAAGNEEKAKSYCKLPVREPGDPSGTYVRQAVYAAAGGRGISVVKKPSDVSDDDWEKLVKAAANEIISAYGEMDEVAPDSVYEAAGKEPPKASKAVEMREAAKGAFLDALHEAEERAVALLPINEQLGRIYSIEDLMGILWNVAENAYWSDASPEDAAGVLKEAIDEFKAEVAAKAVAQSLPADDEPIEGGGELEEEVIPEDEVVAEGKPAPDGEQVPAESEDPPVSETETPAPVADGGDVAMSMVKGKSLSDIAGAFADDHMAELTGQTVAPLQAQPAPQALPAHPAAAVAVTFAEAVKRVVADSEMSAEEQRQAVALALAATMQQLESALPSAQASEMEDAPAWAQAMMNRMNTLETAFQKAVNVGAGPGPESADRPTVPTRKSVPPDLQPSTVVQRGQSLRDVGMQLLFGSADPLTLP